MAAKKKADAAVENTAEVTQETTEQVQDTVEQMTEDNKKELDNKKYVVDHLLSTKREGMEDLIDYMEQIGFFEAPCSGGNHLGVMVRTERTALNRRVILMTRFRTRSMNFVGQRLRNPLMKLQGRSSVVSMATVRKEKTRLPQKVMIMQQYRQG